MGAAFSAKVCGPSNLQRFSPAYVIFCYSLVDYFSLLSFLLLWLCIVQGGISLGQEMLSW